MQEDDDDHDDGDDDDDDAEDADDDDDDDDDRDAHLSRPGWLWNTRSGFGESANILGTSKISY